MDYLIFNLEFYRRLQYIIFSVMRQKLNFTEHCVIPVMLIGFLMSNKKGMVVAKITEFKMQRLEISCLLE